MAKKALEEVLLERIKLSFAHAPHTFTFTQKDPEDVYTLHYLTDCEKDLKALKHTLHIDPMELGRAADQVEPKLFAEAQACRICWKTKEAYKTVDATSLGWQIAAALRIIAGPGLMAEVAHAKTFTQMHKAGISLANAEYEVNGLDFSLSKEQIYSLQNHIRLCTKLLRKHAADFVDSATDVAYFYLPSSLYLKEFWADAPIMGAAYTFGVRNTSGDWHGEIPLQAAGEAQIGKKYYTEIRDLTAAEKAIMLSFCQDGMSVSDAYVAAQAIESNI